MTPKGAGGSTVGYTNDSLASCSLLTAVDGRPQQCESSHYDLPRLNSAYHVTTVKNAGTDSPNVSFISVKKSLVILGLLL